MRVIEMTRHAIRRSSLIVLAVLVPLILAACATRTDDRPTSDSGPPGVLPGHIVTEQGRQAADLYLPVFIIAVIVFLLVEGLLLFAAIRFRRSKHDESLPAQTHGHNGLELLWTAIPALVVSALFVVSTVFTVFFVHRLRRASHAEEMA